MDGGSNKQKSPVFYRTLSPSGPLPCLSFQFTTMQSRATGIADHILPLGDLLDLRVGDGGTWFAVFGPFFFHGFHWGGTFRVGGGYNGQLV